MNELRPLFYAYTVYFWRDYLKAPFVRTTPEKFENAALFLRLGLPSTLIRHENGAFRKRSSNRRNLKMPAFRRFSRGRKIFENGPFRKRWRHDNHVISLTEFSSNTNPKITGDCCVFKFLRRSVEGKHLMRFQSEISVFKFLRCSVEGKHLMRFQSEISVFKFHQRTCSTGGD